MTVLNNNKQPIYPSRHSWTVNNDRKLADYIKIKNFGITTGRNVPSNSKFNGYQLSRSLVNNIVINIINLSNNTTVATVRGRVEDINKVFVHSFNKQQHVDKTLNRTAIIELTKFIIGKPTATDNQIYQYLISKKYKTGTLFEGLSNDQIKQCKNNGQHFIKLTKISASQYKFNDTVKDILRLTNVDGVLVANSYVSRSDGFGYDKKLLSNVRYSKPSYNKITNVIVDYRLANKQMFVIKFDTDNNNGVQIIDSDTKLPVKSLPNNKIQHSVQYIDWNETLTGCTVVFNDNFEITLNVDTVTVTDGKRSKQYGVNTFKSSLLSDKTISWPTTLKDNTNVVITFLNGLNTNLRYNHNTTIVSKFETIYQELSEQDQTNAVTMFKLVKDLFYTLSVDNVSILLYYLVNKDFNKLSFKFINI